MISDDGHALLSDFGIANWFQSDYTMSESGELLRWMAPEVPKPGGKLTTGADIWAWGMTALEVPRSLTPLKSTILPR